MYLTFWKLVQFKPSISIAKWVDSWSQEQPTHNYPICWQEPALCPVPTLTPATPTTLPATTWGRGGSIFFFSHSFASQKEVLISFSSTLVFKLTSHFFPFHTWKVIIHMPLPSYLNDCPSGLPDSTTCHHRPSTPRSQKHSLKSKHFKLQATIHFIQHSL